MILATALLAAAPVAAMTPATAASAATTTAATTTAATTPDAEIRAAAERLAPAVVATRRQLHQQPELSNREEKTGRFVADKLRALGIEVRYPVAKTGAVGILRGGLPGRVVALRTD